MHIYFHIYNKVFILSKHFNLPYDINEKILFYILNTSAQVIINYWYNHIAIHNINLIYLINRLSLKTSYYNNVIYHFYDLHDINVLRTFRICFKYIDYMICSLDWWMDTITYAYNGTFFSNNFDDIIFIQSRNIINMFMVNILNHASNTLHHI